MDSHFSTNRNQLILRPPVAEKPKLPAKPAHIRPGLKPVRVSFASFCEDLNYLAIVLHQNFQGPTPQFDPGAAVKLHPASRSQLTSQSK